MSNASLSASSKFEAAGVESANSRPVTLGTSYTELLSSTSFDWEGFFISGYNVGSAQTLTDIAFGAASSEEDIITSLMMSGVTSVRPHGHHCYFPIRIPSGTRISGKADVASAIRVQLHGCSKAPAGYAPGAGKSLTLAASGGVTVDPGATAHTKGSYTEVVSSTDVDLSGVVISIQKNNLSIASTGSWLFDIAVGAASSEVVILPDLCLASEAITDSFFPEWQGFFPISIPAGSRLSARAQSNLTSSSTRVFDLQLHGIPA